MRLGVVEATGRVADRGSSFHARHQDAIAPLPEVSIDIAARCAVLDNTLTDATRHTPGGRRSRADIASLRVL